MYITKDLGEDEEEQKQQQAPLIGGTAPASSGPSMTTGVGGAQAQPQINPAQKGTGYTSIQSWLDAGKGRDKAVSQKGATALTNEQGTYKKASDEAESGLAGQVVKTIAGSVPAQLNREAGIVPTGPTVNRKPPPLAPGATGGTIGEVLNQTYTGPESIEYKPGQDLTDLALLSSANTIADVTGRDAANKGQYSQFSGLRMLDDALYGADASTVGAAAANKESGKKLVEDVQAKTKDFTDRVAERKGAMGEESKKLKDELKAIYGAEVSRLAKSADDENARAMAESNDTGMIWDEASGRMIPTPAGFVQGAWEGSEAGSATAGNMMSDNDAKRFGALSQFLGYDDAPTKTGDYQAGHRKVQDERQANPAEITPISGELANTWMEYYNHQKQSFPQGNPMFWAANVAEALQGQFNGEDLKQIMNKYAKGDEWQP